MPAKKKVSGRPARRKAAHKAPAKRAAKAPKKVSKGSAGKRAITARKRKFLDYVKAGIEIVKLNERTMVGVSKDKAAFWNGIAIVAIVGVAVAIGSLQPWMIAFLVPLVVLGSFINTGVTHIIALILGGRARYGEFYRTRAVSYVIFWPLVIPFVGFFASIFLSIWDIVVLVVTVRAVHRLSTVRALVAVLLPIILVGILVMFFALFVILGVISGFVW